MGYGNIFGRILLNETLCRTLPAKKAKSKSGIFIDIFPFDCIPYSKYRQKIHAFLVSLFKKIYLYKKKYEISSLNSFKKYIYFYLIKAFSLLPLSFIKKCLLKMINKYSYMAKYKNCLVSKYFGNFNRNINNINVFRHLILAKFEDSFFYIPENFDLYLTGLFGDYMTLPPHEMRYGHHNFLELNFK